mgnify:CR=1 FL=1
MVSMEDLSMIFKKNITFLFITSRKLILLNQGCYIISLRPPLPPSLLLGCLLNNPPIRSLISLLKYCGKVIFSFNMESYIF